MKDFISNRIKLVGCSFRNLFKRRNFFFPRKRSNKVSRSWSSISFELCCVFVSNRFLSLYVYGVEKSSKLLGKEAAKRVGSLHKERRRY